jgi:hypothetical protein
MGERAREKIMDMKHWVKALDGLPVEVRRFLNDDRVAVAINGIDGIMTMDKWRSLPSYTGAFPPRHWFGYPR